MREFVKRKLKYRFKSRLVLPTRKYHPLRGLGILLDTHPLYGPSSIETVATLQVTFLWVHFWIVLEKYLKVITYPDEGYYIWLKVFRNLFVGLLISLIVSLILILWTQKK